MPRLKEKKQKKSGKILLKRKKVGRKKTRHPIHLKKLKKLKKYRIVHSKRSLRKIKKFRDKKNKKKVSHQKKEKKSLYKSSKSSKPVIAKVGIHNDIDNVANEHQEPQETHNVVRQECSKTSNFNFFIDDPLTGTPKEVQIELDRLALRLQKRPRDNDSFNKIHYYIHKYLMGLVFKKYNFVKGHDEKDMYQESLIALFKKAIPKFNPNKGMSFLNFAKMCINRHLITILHASRNRKKDIPINTSISIDQSPIEGNEESGDSVAPLSNVIPDTNKKTLPYKRVVDKESFNCTLNVIKSKLSDFESTVLDEYLNEKSYKEVAKNISKKLKIRFNAKSVDNALLRIRKKAEIILKESSEEDIPLLY